MSNIRRQSKFLNFPGGESGAGHRGGPKKITKKLKMPCMMFTVLFLDE